MSVIGKKLNPIQASGGHGDETTTTTNTQPSKIVTPDDVLRLTTITDDYLCSSGWISFQWLYKKNTKQIAQKKKSKWKTRKKNQ